MTGMSREELLTLPVSVDVVTAGRALGMGRTQVYQLVKASEFPVPVLKLGRRLRVVTADLWKLLGVTPEQIGAAPAGTGTAPTMNPDQSVASVPKDTREHASAA